MAIARSVFGNALDTSQIKLTDDSPLPPNAVSFPNNIKFPKGELNRTAGPQAAEGKRFGDFNHEEQGDILRDNYRKRELGQDTSACQRFVDQVRFGTSDGVFPEPAPPPGPVI